MWVCVVLQSSVVLQSVVGFVGLQTFAVLLSDWCGLLWACRLEWACVDLQPGVDLQNVVALCGLAVWCVLCGLEAWCVLVSSFRLVWTCRLVWFCELADR